MTEPAPYILDVFIRFGLLGLWFVVAFESFEFVFSVPVGPVIVFLGGLASQGNFSVLLLWLVVYSAVVVGDNTGFMVGRKFGRPILHKFGTRFLKPSVISKAERFFLRFGVFAVFFSRFIFATVAAPLNILAGSSDLPWRKYVIAEMAGQVVWTSIYVFLGYFFGKQVEKYIRIIDQANVTAVSLVSLLVVIAVIWIFIRALQHHVGIIRRHRNV
jgi:membrane protein DedA with SNARE-associated domain